MANHIPSFMHVESTDTGQMSPSSYSGIISHKSFGENSDSHARWWPCSSPHVETVMFFIPGNPGLIDFYIPFLSELHRNHRDQGLAILAQAHLGHTPHLKRPVDTSLSRQIEAAIETFDHIKASWSNAKIILVCHSVGSWISTQILKARPDNVDALFMLFPTISNIAQTPNGKLLSWLFNGVISTVISRFSVLLRPISVPMLSFLYPSWPPEQKAVLHSLVCSPDAIYSCLTMAQDEMRSIVAPDSALLNRHSSKLWFYYAARDDWVGKERETVLRILEDPADIKVIHCTHGVPHAFCILHGELIAHQCGEWLRAGKFVEHVLS